MMGDGSAFTRTDVFQMAIRVAFVSAVTYFSIKWLVNQIDPTSKSRKKAEERAREQLRKAGLDGKQSLQLDKLSDHEMIIASQLVVPDEISVSWKDIAGLDHLIQELRETVILPIQKRELFADSRLTQPPKGVLLHGPPGCGKTLIAKATAKEANMSFINLDVSLLTDKWYGETQKLAAAVFSLAVKLQPCIVFIDEIESFLRTRTAHDHEATAMMKTQFMSLWDGLITDSSCTVIIMGATNRPQDLDKAIQRRMPATFHVPMPSEAQREHILQLIMKPEPTASDIDYKRLAVSTEGFSGSDLHELCRQAAVYRVRDMAREEIARERTLPTNRPAGDSEDEFVDAIRPITMDDMRHSLSKLKESKIQCGSLAPSMRTLLDALSWDQFQSVGKRDCIYRTVIRALANVEYSSPNNEQNSRHIEQNSRNLPNAYLEPNSRNPTRESPNSQNVISKYAEHNSKPTSEYPNKNHVEKFYQPTGSNVIANGKCVETYHASEGKSTDKYAEILNSDKSTYDLKYAEESFRTSNNNCSDKNAEKSNQKANPSGTSEKGRIEMNVPSQERYACGGKYAKAPYHATEEYHSELHVQSHHNSNYQRHITTNIDTRPSRISEESSSNNADDSYHTSEENFFEKDKSHVKSKKSISSRVQIADDPKYSVSKEKYATSCEDLNQNPSFKNQQSELPEFLTKEDEILTGNLSSDRKFKGDSNPFFVSNISEINFVIKKPTSFMELDKESDDVAESEQQKEPKN